MSVQATDIFKQIHKVAVLDQNFYFFYVFYFYGVYFYRAAVGVVEIFYEARNSGGKARV